MRDAGTTQDVFSVIAVSENPAEFSYPEEVKYTISKNDPVQYEEAAEFINNQADMCFIQHEFGIFGGENGVFVLSLLLKLRVPVVVSFHTVLNKPTSKQRSLVSAIGQRVSRVFVMSQLGVDFLEHIYKIPKEKISKIEHGVPDFDKVSRETLREQLGFANKRVLMTFGLLSRNKGLETVINALPRIVKTYPDVKYIVLGKTHPNVIRESGEEYRNSLKLLAKKRGIEEHVYFDDRYVTDQELMEMLYACDMYITPYLNEEQITSGTLSYAVGVGTLTLSTPYWHARELLDEQRGVLFPFKDASALADKILNLFASPHEAETIRNSASIYGLQLTWSKIAQKYLQQLGSLSVSYAKGDHVDSFPIDMSLLPRVNFTHLVKLSDHLGILQHTKFDVPNLKEGYCIDDVSRALIMVLMAKKYVLAEELEPLIVRYLSFIHYMQQENGWFHNVLTYNLRFKPALDSEDAFGRTIWALGYLLKESHHDGHLKLASSIIENAMPNIDQLKSIRGRANTLIGLCYFKQKNPLDENAELLINHLAQAIIKDYKINSDAGWHWFEEALTYDNALLPLALLFAYSATEIPDYLKVARQAFHFLETQTLKEGVFYPVGNDNWYRKGQELSTFDQQPLEAMSMVLCYLKFYELTEDGRYLKKMFDTYLWFLGHNVLQQSLYEHETGACYDGLTPEGINENQGAESLLAYWISHFSVMKGYYLQYH
jgi:glycosyltransferase involved in cell wall biosynthesis